MVPPPRRTPLAACPIRNFDPAIARQRPNCRNLRTPAGTKSSNSSLELEGGYLTDVNKDNVDGKAKDIAGRVQREAGESSGDREQQASGIGKQAEGKAQGAAGKVKEAAKRTAARVNKTAHDLTDHEDKDEDAA